MTSAGIDRPALGLREWRPSLQLGDSGAAEWVTARHEPLDAQVATLEMPVLLLWADRDPISPLPIGQRLHELIPNSTLVTFDSDDHWVVLDHVTQVADEINRFLSYSTDGTLPVRSPSSAQLSE